MKKQLIGLATGLVLAACGDDGTNNPQPDAPTTDDAPITPDSPDPDAPPSWTAPAAHSFQWSAAGHDRAYSIAVGADGKWYVAGYRATVLDGAKNIIVTRLLANGMPDTTWGTGGTFDTGVEFKGGDDEIDIFHVGSNAFVISATVAAAELNAVDAADTDIGLIKIKNDSSNDAELDTSFGGGDGIAVHSLNTSALNSATPPAPTARDQVRGLFVDANGGIFIHGAARGLGNVQGGATPRTDTDFVVAKFIADGTGFDDAFSTDGKFEQDLYNNGASSHSNATARGIIVLGDGSILAGGYANAGLTTGPQIVMYKLTAAGELDTAFNPNGSIPGLYHTTVLGVQTEAYGFAVQGSNVVTGGYGRDSGDINDWISLRFNATTAVRDTTWGSGDFTDGKVFFDPTPSNSASGSNCRAAYALPGNKTILLGSSNRDVTTGGMNQNQDATFAILTANGTLDTAYGTGIATYMLGNDGADTFWGAANNGTHALIVGWRATVGTASATNNDDAYAVLLPLE